MLPFERPLACAVWLAATLRIGLGLVAGLTVAFDARPLMRDIAAWTSLELPPRGVAGLVLSPWQRWDTLWYQHVAEHGYSATDGSLEFFPLFPLLSKLVSPRTIFAYAGWLIPDFSASCSCVISRRLRSDSKTCHSAFRTYLFTIARHVQSQYSSSDSPFHAKTGTPVAAMAAAA